MTAPAPVPASQLPTAARIVADALNTRIPAIVALFGESFTRFTLWVDERLPEVSDGVLGRLDRDAIVQLLDDVRDSAGSFEADRPDVYGLADVIASYPAEMRAIVVRNITRDHGLLWLDETSHVRLLEEAPLSNEEEHWIDGCLILLAALGWEPSHAHLHPLRAPALYHPLSDREEQAFALTFLDCHGVDNIVTRCCPDISGHVRASLFAALLAAQMDHAEGLVAAGAR